MYSMEARKITETVASSTDNDRSGQGSYASACNRDASSAQLPDASNSSVSMEEESGSECPSSPSIDLGHWDDEGAGEDEAEGRGWRTEAIDGRFESDLNRERIARWNDSIQRPETLYPSPCISSRLTSRQSSDAGMTIDPTPPFKATTSTTDLETPILPALCSSYPLTQTTSRLKTLVKPGGALLKPQDLATHRKIVASRVPLFVSRPLPVDGLHNGSIPLRNPPCAQKRRVEEVAEGPASGLLGTPQNILGANGQFNETLARMIEDAKRRCATFDEVCKRMRTDTGWTPGTTSHEGL
ncbi:hypothetical protein BC830DRAFT_1079721 [Chytriomyces sp. MP71]|nr:hypothetical protein BC830DRAFT_1079721 [Chytriomyces sp. MP71]